MIALIVEGLKPKAASYEATAKELRLRADS
jgi:hypothetical protein